MELIKLEWNQVDRARLLCKLLAHDDRISRSGRDVLTDAARVLAWVQRDLFDPEL